MSLAVPEQSESAGLPHLDHLFRTHYERVARVIGRVIHDRARAEELAVEVFLKWNRNPKAHGDGAEGWIYRTAVREALDELRRESRRSRFAKVILPFLREPPPTPEQVYASEMRQITVRATLAAMKNQMAAILLLWSEGLSYREMAEALHLHPNYVGSLLSRAQEAFRKEYEKRYGTDCEQ